MDIRRPVAIYPLRATPRIAAQSGCFTVHGLETEGIEQQFRGATASHGHLARVIIADVPRVDRELGFLGMSKFRLFPEPSYLAAYLRSCYQEP